MVDALEAALWAFWSTDSFEDGALAAVNLGDDADTTGAIYGQLAGAYYGVDGIPERWRSRHRPGGADPRACRCLVGLQRIPARRDDPMKPRTSHSHPLEIAALDTPGGGRIGMTFCPGKQDPFAMTGAWARDLDTDLAAIRAWGASALVTLMEQHELVHLRVGRLGEAVQVARPRLVSPADPGRVGPVQRIRDGSGAPAARSCASVCSAGSPWSSTAAAAWAGPG